MNWSYVLLLESWCLFVHFFHICAVIQHGTTPILCFCVGETCITDRSTQLSFLMQCDWSGLNPLLQFPADKPVVGGSQSSVVCPVYLGIYLCRGSCGCGTTPTARRQKRSAVSRTGNRTALVSSVWAEFSVKGAGTLFLCSQEAQQHIENGQAAMPVQNASVNLASKNCRPKYKNKWHIQKNNNIIYI